MKKAVFSLLLFPILFQTSFAQSSSRTSQTRDLDGFTAIDLQMAATVHVTQDNHFSVQVSASNDLLDKIITEVEDHTLMIYTKQKDWWKLREDVSISITMPKPNQLHVNGSGAILAENNFLTDYLSLEVHGSGKINMKDYKAQKTEAGVYGSGDIKIDNVVTDGMVEELEGSGSIEVASLKSSLASISISGSGNIKSNELSAEKLDASLGGSGFIGINKGVANKILLEINGSGRIIAPDLVGQIVSAKLSGSGNISISAVDALEASVVGSGNVSYRGNPANISKSVTGSGSVRAQ